jgi:hypothetical protein
MASRMRWLIAGVVAAAALGPAAGATIAVSESVQLQWEQLIPQDGSAGGGSGQVVPRGVVQHGELTPSPEGLGGLVHDWSYDHRHQRLCLACTMEWVTPGNLTRRLDRRNAPDEQDPRRAGYATSEADPPVRFNCQGEVTEFRLRAA